MVTVACRGEGANGALARASKAGGHPRQEGIQGRRASKASGHPKSKITKIYAVTR